MAEDYEVKIKMAFGFFEMEANPFSFLSGFTHYLDIFLYGAQGTGKTSFVKALFDAPVEEIYGISKTTAVQRGKIPYTHTNATKRFQISIKYSDSPGDSKLRKQMLEEIAKKNPPLVTLLFLDHFDTRKKQHQDFADKPNPSAAEVRTWEIQNLKSLGRADDSRIEENRAAIQDLYDGFCAYQILRNHCCLIVPVVTKRDLWEQFYRRDFFYEIFQNELQLFSRLGLRVTNIMPCSTTLNVKNSIYEIMRLIDDETRKDRTLAAKIKRSLAKR